MMITKEMIKNALATRTIRFEVDPEKCHGTVCKIGRENILLDLALNPSDFVESLSLNEIQTVVFSKLQDLRRHDRQAYAYCEEYIQNNASQQQAPHRFLVFLRDDCIRDSQGNFKSPESVDFSDDDSSQWEDVSGHILLMDVMTSSRAVLKRHIRKAYPDADPNCFRIMEIPTQTCEYALEAVS